MSEVVDSSSVKVTFQQDPESIKIGGNRYLWRRYGTAMRIRVALAILVILVGCVKLFDEEMPIPLSVFFFVLGAMILRGAFSYGGRLKKAHEKGHFHFGEVSMSCEFDHLATKHPLAESKIKWDMIVGYSVCKDGILIYPHFAQFYWIPADADFHQHSYADFVSAVQQKVSCKIPC